MLGSRPRPMIRKLSELLISGNRSSESATSPRSPLELNCKMQSPKGLKSYDLGGVGLGIVVALDNKPSEGGREVLPKYAICSYNLCRSHQISVLSGKNGDGFQRNDQIEVESSEDYTCVTYRVPNKTTITKVYYGGQGEILRHGFDNLGGKTFEKQVVEAENSFPYSDFLSSCHLCMKKLHGKDIYMYRGEKAFCSSECRSRQIMMDERTEQCRSEVVRSGDVLSTSPYNTRDDIFSTGILAI